MSAPTRSVPDDLVQPFRIDPFALRGRLVRLGPAIDRILSQHAYLEPVAAMLGEAITLAVVLAGALKYDGIFTLQTKGDGPIRLMVADVSTDGAVRGYAQYDQAKLDAVPTAEAAAGVSLSACRGCSAADISLSPSIRRGDRPLSRDRRAGGRHPGRLRAALFPAIGADPGRHQTCGRPDRSGRYLASRRVECYNGCRPRAVIEPPQGREVAGDGPHLGEGRARPRLEQAPRVRRAKLRRGPRSRRRSPTSASRRARACDSVGCATWARRAARVTLFSSTQARKYSRSRSSMAGAMLAGHGWHRKVPWARAPRAPSCGA